MSRPTTPSERAGFRSSDIATYFVVGVSYLVTFISYPNTRAFWTGFALLALGILYTFLSVVGIDRCERSSALVRAAFFGLQASIGIAIFYLSDGGASLVILPACAQSVFLFSRRGVVLANGLVLLAFAAVVWSFGYNWNDTLQSTLFILAAIVFVVVFTYITMGEQRMRTEMERLADELSEANRKLREYTLKAETLATVQERNRLAREIHDGLGHYLTAVNMQIKAAQAVMVQDPSLAQDALGKAQTLAQDALADVRRSVSALREEATQNRPLPELIENLLAECQTAGLVANLHTQGDLPAALPLEISQTLYRAAQEALTNVRKHALASEVKVDLAFFPNEIRLAVRDNGVGAHGTDGGFGLFGLRERVQLLGGRLELNTAPGEGFSLEILIPVAQ